MVFASTFDGYLLTIFSPEIQVGVDRGVYTKCMQGNPDFL
jgi:hypothetical protein